MFRLLSCWVMLISALAAAAAVETPPFTAFEMGTWASGLGGTSLVDIDRDGDLDFTVAAKGGAISWWEYRGDDNWVNHLLHSSNTSEVGGIAYDVDGDGWIDYVAGKAWYRNPGNPRNATFTKYSIGRGISAHDTAIGDIDGDGDIDVVHMQTNALAWFEAPADPRQPWTQHDFGSGIHAGLALGDLDGDGDLDVVRGDRWYENNGTGGGWREHMYTTQLIARNGSVAAVGDIDGDGDMDIALAAHDAEKIGWMENTNGRGQFRERFLYGGMSVCHSVIIADFNNDGRQDIYAGDTGNNGGKAYIWYQTGSTLQRVTIATGVAGHNTQAADVDGDGDLDLVSKPWRGNKKHWYIRNDLITDTRPPPPPNSRPQADAGNDRRIADSNGVSGERVRLDGSASRDEDGRIVRWEWSLARRPLATGQRPTVTLIDGSHTLTLTVTDDDGATATDTVRIVVEAPVAAHRLLIFSKTAGFRHRASIDAGRAAITSLVEARGWAADSSENGADINTDNLSRYDVVVFLNTTGNFLSVTQQAAFERYIQAGGGWVGMHAAADAYGGRNHAASWPWYSGLLGNAAHFARHPANGSADLLRVVNHAATNNLPQPFTISDEWYVFTADPGEQATILLQIADTHHNRDLRGAPVAWCHAYDGGRAFYSSMGHRAEIFSNPDYLSHLWGGIEWASGVGPVPTPPTPPPANAAPTAHAGPDQRVADSDGEAGERVRLDGRSSRDSDGTITRWSWTRGGGIIATGSRPYVELPDGNHVLTLMVTDNAGATASDTVRITVVPPPANQPPVANAGPDRSVTDSDGQAGELVRLDGRASRDPDGRIVSYSWTLAGAQIGTGSRPSLALADGTHSISLTVTDEHGATASDQVSITIAAPVDPGPPHSHPQGLLREWWTGIRGGRLTNLTSAATYPHAPTGADILSKAEAHSWDDSERSVNWANEYGQRVRGYVIAPTSGTYHFWISGDDQCSLLLSTDGTVANARQIAEVGRWTRYQQWNRYGTQRSAAIELVAGQVYYLEALHKENRGGDSLSIGWLKPGQTGDVPSEIIPGDVLRAYTDGSIPGNGPAPSPNEVPLAHAGSDLQVDVGSAVVLDGSASQDPDFGPMPLTYAWSQRAGPRVSLSGATTVNPSFTPLQPGIYEFDLVVDDSLDTAQDRIRVVVHQVTVPPEPTQDPITLTSVSTGKEYSLADLLPGTKVYMDRRYAVRTLGPTFLHSDSWVLQVSNSDKRVTTDPHVRAVANEALRLFICLDKRSRHVPAWMQDRWQSTADSGVSITVNDGASPYRIFHRDYVAGEPIVLGGSGGSGNSHYVVLLVVQPTGGNG